jgi:hypothetical protein
MIDTGMILFIVNTKGATGLGLPAAKVRRVQDGFEVCQREDNGHDVGIRPFGCE